MKTKTLVLTAIISLGMVFQGCEKEEGNYEKVNSSINKKDSKSIMNEKSSSSYPINITKDLSDIDDLVDAYNELEPGEYIKTTVNDSSVTNQILYNPEPTGFPNDSISNSEWNVICHITEPGCLYWAAQHHLDNLAYCDNSYIGHGFNGYVVVIGIGCNIV